MSSHEHNHQFVEKEKVRETVSEGVYQTCWWHGDQVIDPEVYRWDTLFEFVCPCGDRRIKRDMGEKKENDCTFLGNWREK